MDCMLMYVSTYVCVQKRRLGNIRETQASILRKYTEPVEPGPYWHMKRFQSVSSVDYMHAFQWYTALMDHAW